jgi:hypothetical protein
MTRSVPFALGLCCLASLAGTISVADSLSLQPSQHRGLSKKPYLSFASQPLTFEPNQGQNASSAQFFTRSPGYGVQMMPSRAEFEFSSNNRQAIQGLLLWIS